jgi:pyrrolysine biosynthesis protein PylD
VTRLTTGDIQGISEELPTYESSLIGKTGCSLRQLACRAMGVTEKDVRASMERAVVGVIPMTSGDGVLKGFCGTVAKIADHIGCRVFVTLDTDAAGIAEAVQRSADILMFADEDRFVALDMQHRKLVDNADATGKGFVAGLHLMAGSLKARNVLVLGCGRVGRSAVKALMKTGCRIAVYDVEPAAYGRLSAEFNNDPDIGVQFLNNLDPALHHHELIVDASPAGNFIPARHIKPHTIVSAPGVPIGLDRSALVAIGDRLLHDPLQIGVATMLVGALAGFKDSWG